MDNEDNGEAKDSAIEAMDCEMNLDGKEQK
jgi:hypothetical protein